LKIATDEAAAAVPAAQQGGAAVTFAPAPYPPLNAFNPAPANFTTTILGAQANTPPCGQVPSNGAMAAPVVAPVSQVPAPDPSNFKTVFVTQDPNAAGKK
jgi:hypothetical protein